MTPEQTKEITDALNRHYEQGLDHAIQIVEAIFLKREFVFSNKAYEAIVTTILELKPSHEIRNQNTNISGSISNG